MRRHRRNMQVQRLSKAVTWATAALVIHFWAASTTEAGMQIGATINATFNTEGPNAGSDVRVSLANYGSFHLSQGGPMNWTFINGLNSSPSFDSFSNPFVDISGQINGNSFVTFCVEISQDISLGHTYGYTIENVTDAPNSTIGGMGTAASTQIEQMWAHYFPFNSSTPDVSAAAFQLAIWKLEYDQNQLSAASSFTEWQLFGHGNLTATGINHTSTDASILNLATAMVNWVEANKNLAGTPQANLFAMVSSNHQDQIGEVPGSGGNGGQGTVPEPATAVMCLMGCACMGARRSWRLLSALPRAIAT